jgi:hypothetical protein
VFTARYGPTVYSSNHCVTFSPRTNTNYASYLREGSIRIGRATTMGGPSASTSNCSHDRKESAFHKKLSLQIGIATCGLKS